MGVLFAENSGFLSDNWFARAMNNASSKPPIITVAARYAPAPRHFWHSIHRSTRINRICSSATMEEKSGGVNRVADSFLAVTVSTSARSAVNALLARFNAVTYVARAAFFAVELSTCRYASSTFLRDDSETSGRTTFLYELNHVFSNCVYSEGPASGAVQIPESLRIVECFSGAWQDVSCPLVGYCLAISLM